MEFPRDYTPASLSFLKAFKQIAKHRFHVVENMKHTLEVRRELISFAAEQPRHAVEGRGGSLSSSVMVGGGVEWSGVSVGSISARVSPSARTTEFLREPRMLNCCGPYVILTSQPLEAQMNMNILFHEMLPDAPGLAFDFLNL